jgi:hypothetical protein
MENRQQTKSNENTSHRPGELKKAKNSSGWFITSVTRTNIILMSCDIPISQ